jgi:uncharacterized protein YecE (DUF72 family)
VRVRVGTSGYSYKEWRGTFYPSDLPSSEMLRFYATRLDTVEINNTFYRMPTPEMLTRWAGEVGDPFVFVLKAARRITHERRLSAEAVPEAARFLETAACLGDRLGPVLFQLPPFLKKDAGRLREFLASLPASCRAALEFRHESWFDDEVYEILRERGAALCASDTDDSGTEGPPLVATGAWGYLRLRRQDYAAADLAAWVQRIGAQAWSEAFVFFKHEDEGKGPELAARFKELLPRPG